MERKEIFEMGKRIQTKEIAGEEGVVRKGLEWRGNERRRREEVEMRGQASRI